MIQRALPLLALCLPIPAQNNAPVSVSSAGTLANKDSYYSLISADGRFVVFQSDANNLAAGDMNGQQDIYRRDLLTNTTELASKAMSGNAGNGIAVAPAISGDGRFVAWSTNASNIVSGDTNGTWDVFLRDMSSGTNMRLSLTSTGAEASLRSDQPRMSPDANWITFESNADLVPGDTNGLQDIYRLDRATNTLALVSTSSTGVQGNGVSYAAEPSHDGRYVVFFSTASNLVAGDTNSQGDVFWKDMQTGTLLRANVSSSGVQANNETIWPSISGDGQTVTYCSAAGNLVTGDSNNNWDAFAFDIATLTTTRLNVQPNGAQANSYTRSPTAMSADGRLVVFASLGTNLVPGDTNNVQDVFLRDRLLQVTKRLNFSFDGSQANSDSFVPHITPDAKVLTFTSTASNIVAGDTNGFRDIFASFLDTSTTVYCTAKTSSSGCVPTIGSTGAPSLAGPSNFVLTTSNVETGQNGITFFGTSGPQFVAFQGGTLCLKAPLFRLMVQNAGGSLPCTGSYSYTLTDMLNQSGGGGAGLLVGSFSYVQSWFRDPPSASTTGLSNALEILIQP